MLRDELGKVFPATKNSEILGPFGQLIGTGGSRTAGNKRKLAQRKLDTMGWAQLV